MSLSFLVVDEASNDKYRYRVEGEGGKAIPVVYRRTAIRCPQESINDTPLRAERAQWVQLAKKYQSRKFRASDYSGQDYKWNCGCI